MINLSEGHRPRAIRFLGLERFEDWTLKVYGISARQKTTRQTFIDDAKRIANQHLPRPAVQEDRHGAAIVIAHEGNEGNEGNFILLDFWTGENMLSQQMFFAPLDNLSEFRRMDESDIIACVWEMQVLHFESNAWIKHILKHHDRPDFEGYFAAQLNTEI